MANLANASVTIVPKFDGLTAAVQREFDKIRAQESGEGAGQRYGRGMGSGLAKSGAVIGIFTAVTNKALSSISSHVGDAVRRFDTLNNYPRVMESLGYGTEAADASIKKMSDRLQSLPTTLDSMVSMTQGLVVSTNDLGKATDAALAINDMLLASGSNQQLVNSAQEQFRQILAKGKPEMQDWKSLSMAMPGQLDQLAKSMLGPTANANDLYAALGGGKSKQAISMDQLLDEIIRLDQEGGEGFASFQEQAETASGGVQTSMANMGNAVTRGITGVMEEVGRESIAGFFNDMKQSINDVFGFARSVVPTIKPVVGGLLDVVKQYGPALLGVASGYAVVSKTSSGIKGIASGVTSRIADAEKAATKAGKSFGIMGKASAALGGPLNLASAAIGVGVVAFTAISGVIEEARKREENFTKATSGLNAAVSNAASLDEYKGKVDGIGESAGLNAMSIVELRESLAGRVDAMNEANAKAEEQIGKLNSAQQVIKDYAGQTDLSSQAQGELEYAIKTVNEQLGLNLTATDVMNGKYTDANGNVRDLASSIDELVEAKKREIQMEALSDDLSEAYSGRSEASKTYASELNARAEGVNRLNASLANGTITQKEYDDAVAAWDDRVGKAKQHYDDWDAEIKRLNGELGDTAKSTSDAADAYDKWGNSVGEFFSDRLTGKGTSLAALKDDMRGLGADTEALGKLTDDQLNQIADAYDGTSSSIVGVLAGMGIPMDEAAAKVAKMSAGIRDAVTGMGIDGAFESAGVNLETFSNSLAEAGVSTEQLNAIGSDNLASLAQACAGNVEMMIYFIQHYNDTPIFDKDGNIQVNQASLVDAQGKVYTWNGTQLIDKEGNAVVDDTTLVDAQGNVLIWDAGGSRLVNKQGNVWVGGNIDKANNSIDEFQRKPDNLGTKEGHVNIFENIAKTVTSIFGFGDKSGGFYKFHAGGGFLTSGVTPLGRDANGVQHIAGEDGIEWVMKHADGTTSIVPIENRKYLEPYASVIASMIPNRGGTTVNETNIHMDYRAGEDAKTIVRDMARRIRRQSLMRG